MSRPVLLRRWLMPAILCLASSGVHAQVKIESTLFATGGANAANATTHLTGSFGQPIIGVTTAMHRHLMQGFWYASEPALPSSTEPVAGELTPQLQCVPNPVAQEAVVYATLPKEGVAAFALYDLTGKEVMTLMDATRDRTEHTLHLDVRELAPGGYTLVLLSDEEQVSLPIRIVR